MSDDLLLDRLRSAAAAAGDAGSPVAQSEHELLATTALRRWRSFDRRTKKKNPTLEERVEDLAKGIRDRFEPHRSLVGPLMVDYRHLATVLADVLRTRDE